VKFRVRVKRQRAQDLLMAGTQHLRQERGFALLVLEERSGHLAVGHLRLHLLQRLRT